jgi:hypothetical protein
MLSKLEVNFGKYKNDDLLSLGQNVVAQITSNTSFFNQEVLTQKDQLKPMCIEFANHIDAAKSRSTVEIDKRNSYKVLFIRKLKIISTLINLDYRGDDTVLDASGFKVIKISKNLTITDITDVVLSQSETKGYINVKMVGGNNFRTIKVMYTDDKSLDENQWPYKMVTTKTTSIGEFPSMTGIYVKLIAYGKEGTSVSSAIKSIGVQ